MPLVKNIAIYFSKLNVGAELDDLIQEGVLGLLMAAKKYDSTRKITFGAFANKYVFGRIYRSLLGTRNLCHNKKIVLLEDGDRIVDDRMNQDLSMIEFVEYLESKYDKVTSSVLKMHLDNYKKTEIIRKHNLTLDEYNKIIEQFDRDLE